MINNLQFVTIGNQENVPVFSISSLMELMPFLIEASEQNILIKPDIKEIVSKVYCYQLNNIIVVSDKLPK